MNGTDLRSRQIYGAIIIVLLVVFVYAARDIFRYLASPGVVTLSSQWEWSGITVELAGDRDHDGIYFLPNGATVRDLIREAGVDDIEGLRGSDLVGILHSGNRITCDKARCRVTIDDMTASTRLALGIAIDLNTATLEELMLIPGIGRTTASEIVQVREEEGPFSELEALKGIRALGQKRYDKIKQFLSINGDCCS